MAYDAATTAGELIGCLKRQADQFRIFLDLLARQREALVTRNTPELERIVAEQEQAISASRRLEQHRRALTSRLADLSEGAEPPLNLAALRELVAASDASRLDTLLETLGGLQKEIERRQKLNRTLIEQSMRCTAETLQWIARRIRPQAVYTQGATPPSGAGQLAVNRRC